MEEIIRFVMLARSERFTVSGLCEQFGISRKTGDKYLDRYAAEGLKGLAQRSHHPLVSKIAIWDNWLDVTNLFTSVLLPKLASQRFSGFGWAGVVKRGRITAL